MIIPFLVFIGTMIYLLGVLGSHKLFTLYYKNEKISLSTCFIWPLIVAVIGFRQIDKFQKAVERAFHELNKNS